MKRFLSLLAVVPLAVLAGCAGGPSQKGPTQAELSAAMARAEAEHVPASLRDQYVDLLTGGEADYVDIAMRLGLSAARLGEYDFAARVWDEAIRRVAALQEGAKQAERAKSNFVAEQEKWFKGENYERSALYLYRGLLYLQAGDYGNAAACAKRCQLEDISSHEQDQGDWYSAEWLLAYASLLQADPATAKDALARAANFYSKQGVVPPPDPSWNLLIVGEAGQAPIKIRRGEYGEELVILEGGCKTVRVAVTAAAPPASPPVAAAENLYFQASTRGDRKVDHILAGKAVFKSATDIGGDAAIVAGAGTAATSRSETQSLVGLGLIVGGIVSKAVSGASKPEADIRTWDNLPHSLFLTGLHVPAGPVKITVDALDAAGAKVGSESRTVTISDNKPPAELWLRLP